jgi:hypothetical protein
MYICDNTFPNKASYLFLWEEMINYIQTQQSDIDVMPSLPLWLL